MEIFCYGFGCYRPSNDLRKLLILRAGHKFAKLCVTRSENIQNFPCFTFQQTVMFLRAIGCKKTFSIIKVCPQLILTSAFGLWVFGPVKSGFCSGGFCKRSNKISVSFGHSWINVLITGTVTDFSS